MRRLLQDHHHLQPCPDSGALFRLLFNPLSTTRGQMQTDCRLCIQKKIFLRKKNPPKHPWQAAERTINKWVWALHSMILNVANSCWRNPLYMYSNLMWGIISSPYKVLQDRVEEELRKLNFTHAHVDIPKWSDFIIFLLNWYDEAPNVKKVGLLLLTY